MSRCIIVLGTGRSGTSAISSVLNNLGVHMGDWFVETPRNNPEGTFEDGELFDMARDVLTGTKLIEEYKPIILERANEHSIWGMKDPLLSSFAHYIWDILLEHRHEVRIIFAKRPRHETINSYMRACHSGRITANRWYDDSMRNLAARAIEWEGPILDVDFNELKRDPQGQVARIMHFAFEGRELPGPAEYNVAVAHIDPLSGDKSTRRDWGKIAVGTRIAKHPEPNFFISWTELLTGGLRSTDKVLMPAAQLPAHQAAQKLAKNFLAGECDSVLFIDDDQVFSGDTLHRMRENIDNWDYDAVSALIVRRNPDKPTPVVMLLMDKEGEPEDLTGDSFYAVPQVELGKVIEVDAVGLGFTLIKRHVLETMLNEKWGADYTYQELFQYGPGRESDDIPFSRRCRELGFRMAVDTSIEVGHVAAVTLGYDYFMKWLEENKDEYPAIRV